MGDDETRIAIIGTGFAGLGMAIRLKQEGIDDFVVLEKADDVGGTWRENTYPGVQCDVPSHLYSFSFAPNPDWTRTFPLGDEIRDYLRDCAQRYGVLPHIRFGREVRSAEWDDDAQRWTLETSDETLTAQILVAGTGPLHEPSIPDLPGLDGFAGRAFHSAQWDHTHDLTNERVAVVGTGASAIQFIPRIQPDVSELDRLPAHAAVGRAPQRPRDHAAGEAGVREASRRPAGHARGHLLGPRDLRPRVHRQAVRQARPRGWRAGTSPSRCPDPELRRKLTPSYTIGCKRVLISNDYYPALMQPNVELVTDGIAEVRPHAIVTADGTEHEVDTIIFGTGFHVTDPPAAEVVRGRDGRTLAETWDGSMQAHRGTTIAGFPNLFFLVGPNTGLGHNSIVFMIESQLNYVLDALRTMDAARRRVRGRPARGPGGLQRAHPGAAAQARCGTPAGARAGTSTRNGRNTTLWPGFTWPFRRLLRHFDAEHYELRAPARVPEPVARRRPRESPAGTAASPAPPSAR